MGEVEVVFKTDLGADWIIPGSFWINISSGKTELQDTILQLVQKQGNLLLLLNGDLITSSLEEHMRTQGVSTEQKVEVWFAIEASPPSSQGELLCEDWISHVQLSSHGTFFSDYSGKISNYDLNEKIFDSQLFNLPLKSFNYNENSGYLIAGAKSGDLKIQNYADNQLENVAQGKTKHIEKIVSNPSGTMWAIGHYSGEISLARISDEFSVSRNDNKRQKSESSAISFTQLALPVTDCITGLVWPTLDLLITSSTDHSVLSIDLESQSVISSILAPRSVQAFGFYNDIIAAGFENGATQLYDHRNSQKVCLLDGKSWVRAVGMKGGYVVTGHENGKLRIFDKRSPKIPLHELEAHDGKVLSLDWSDSLIASGGSDSKIKYNTFS